MSLTQPLRNNEIERTRYGVVGGVTEQTPRTGVPEVDDALAISSDDCVGAHGQNGLSDCMRNVHDSTSRMIVRPHRIPTRQSRGSSAQRIKVIVHRALHGA